MWGGSAAQGKDKGKTHKGKWRDRCLGIGKGLKGTKRSGEIDVLAAGKGLERHRGETQREIDVLGAVKGVEERRGVESLMTEGW